MSITLRLNPNGGQRNVSVEDVRRKLLKHAYIVRTATQEDTGTVQLRIYKQGMEVARADGKTEEAALALAINAVISRMTITQRYEFFEGWE